MAAIGTRVEQHSGDDLGGYARSNEVNELCTMQIQIFGQAVLLVRAVGAEVIGEIDAPMPEINYMPLRLYRNLQIYGNRLVRFPAKFLWMGIREILKSIYVWSVLVGFISFMLVAWFFSIPSTARTEVANLVGVAFAAASIFSAFLVVFPMPSIYGDSGVSPKSVEFVVTHLTDHSFTTVKEIELLKKSVKPFEDRTRSRVTALKWIVSLVWAGLSYIFTNFIDPKVVDPKIFGVSIPQIVLLGFILLLSYLCVWGYEAALDKLFRAIEFGCNDFCHHVEQIEQTEGVSLRGSAVSGDLFI
jgi:hypothetical protein